MNENFKQSFVSRRCTAWVGLAMLLLPLWGCANQVAPSGGPEDKTPPRVINTIPANEAVRVPRDVEIEFEFSEKIDRDTFRDALFISPEPAEDIKLKFKGRRVKLRFQSPLLPERTYVITLGTNLKDNHGVPMAGSFTLAFSTGSRLDKGEIAGRVVEDKPQGILIWAYILDDSTGVDPRQRGGDYATQAGKAGEFSIPFIAAGRYRVFAVADRGNGVYDPVEDRIGVADRDVVIDTAYSPVRPLLFRMTREDTLGPVLRSASMPSPQVIEVRFDEPVLASDSLAAAHFRLRNDRGDSIAVLAAVPSPFDAKVFFLRIARQSAADSLSLHAVFLQDSAGNAMAEAFSRVRFAANVRPDTLAPRVVRVLPGTGTPLMPKQPVRILFSEWLQQPDSLAGIQVQDSAGTNLPVQIRQSSPFAVDLRPLQNWPGKAPIFLRIVPEFFHDLAGNALFDTTAARVLHTINPDTLTAIRGEVVIADSTLHVPVYLTARQVQGGEAVRTTRVDSSGRYAFEDLLPGVYLIDGFFDSNGNGRYDFGSVLPFVPSERFFLYPDSIKVRSRWPNEGNVIEVR